MIAYLQGRIDRLTPTNAYIECGGVGYNVHITLASYSALQGKEESRLWITEVLREDTHDLYGFATEDEREFFEKLTTVSGVGPSTARLILSSYAPSELATFIETGDVDRLKMVKGIGLKTAQRIIVDLKGKVRLDYEADVDGADGTMHLSSSTHSEEATRALKMLGFTDANIKKATKTILKSDPNLTVEEIIKQALKIL